MIFRTEIFGWIPKPAIRCLLNSMNRKQNGPRHKLQHVPPHLRRLYHYVIYYGHEKKAPRNIGAQNVKS